jgi:hypothetical protein
MVYNPVLKNISKHIKLNKNETDYFTSLLHQQKVLKKEFVLKEG